MASLRLNTPSGGSLTITPEDTNSSYTLNLPSSNATLLTTQEIGASVQAYDADTAKYDDATANFTGTLQNNGSNVLVDSDIGTTVQAYDVDIPTVSATQAEMEAGTETALRSMSPLRIKEAINALAPPPRTKVWTAITSTGTYVVPAGVTSIRAYAFGKGGDGRAAYNDGAGGGGGGCAFGDIAVTPGSTVSANITSGVATVIYDGITLLTANPGSNGATGPTGGAGGSATKHASVINGGAYSGGAGGSHSFGGGGSAGSPLGNGYSTTAGGGGGAGGAGNTNGGGAGAVVNRRPHVGIFEADRDFFLRLFGTARPNYTDFDCDQIRLRTTEYRRCCRIHANDSPRRWHAADYGRL